MSVLRFRYDDLARLAAPVIAAALEGCAETNRACLEGWHVIGKIAFHIRRWVTARRGKRGQVWIEIEESEDEEEKQGERAGGCVARSS